MNVFLVQVSGKPIEFRIDEKPQKGGFFKNEYVLARNADEAVRLAKEKVWEALHVRGNVDFRSMAKEDLHIEKVVRAVAFWRLFFGQGFIFYPADS